MTTAFHRLLGTTALVPALFAFAACGSRSSSDVSASSPTNSTATPPASKTTTGAKATIEKVGFGQQDEYVWTTALVKNETSDAGQTVTVHFNLKDAKGKVVASGDQVSAFNWAGQEVPIGTQISAPKHVEIASVDATVDVEDDGIGTPSDDWGTFKGNLYKDYGQWAARFTVKNPTDKPLKGSALQIICVSAKGDIIGGDAEFPELIPASGVTVVDSTNLYLNQKPKSCTGYLTPWM
jgi:hypothetical protein